MAAQRYLFAVVYGLTALAPLTACSRGSPGTASGEEIEAAVRHAERERAEARANASSRSRDEPLILTALPF